MHWDSALNLAWLACGALLLAVIAQSKRPVPLRSHRLWQPALRALVLAATLFPFISASDDLIWLASRVRPADHQHQHSNGGTHHTRALLALYQVVDSSIPAAVAVTRCWFTSEPVVSCSSVQSRTPSPSAAAGRAPPAEALPV